MRAQPQNKTLLAAGLVVLAMSSIGFSDNLVYFISDDIGVWQMHAIRNVISCVLLALIGVYLKWDFVPKKKIWVLLRSLFITSGAMLYFAVIAYMPIAQAGAALFAAPIFVLIFSVLLFKERIGLWRIGAIFLGFIGVLLVLKPSASDFSILSVLPLIGAAFYALGLIVTRVKCSDEAAGVLAFWFLATMAIYGMIGASYFFWISPPAEADITFATRGWIWPSAYATGIITLMAAIAMGVMTAQAKAYQMADASYLAVYEYSFLISVGFFGWVMWGQAMDWLSIIGMGAIIVSGALIAIRSKDA
ncbi:DMT family transporter [Amylibacter sp. SFDW26]|uniref:DMT family transporter n=1 Tax=Amylibacter sp. SFDW26 TaxID=2652722 RepID=UPI0012615DBD|nr:DMT family transporter [Amylibacter sp. SFDW26]KAB7613669.1 DMT family transporter [Amylibacter sp. SFDW26]